MFELKRNEETDWDTKPLLNRDHFHTEFDTYAYLTDFYAKVDDPAMQMVLKFLPGMAARLPKASSLLDFGAGPTIHVAVCFRERIEKIYLADYLPQNRKELENWLNCRSSFDWTETLRIIATHEGLDWSCLQKMETATRAKISGIFKCDCLDDRVLEAPVELLGKFDKVVSIFTLEYCCNTIDEYRAAVRRVASLIRPGGYLILGGIFEETWCSFGGRKFSCLYITRQFMLECLANEGLIVSDDHKDKPILYEINGMFMIAAKKAQ